MPTPNRLIFPALAVVWITAGCESLSSLTGPDEPEVAFGGAVRAVMNAQIHDYDAAINPAPEAVEGSDPNRLNNVVTTYREHISKPEEVRQPLELSVGSN